MLANMQSQKMQIALEKCIYEAQACIQQMA